MKNIVVGLGVIATAMALGTTTSSAKELSLRGGFFIPAAKEPFKVAFMKWIESINKEGKGLIQIRQVVGPEAIPGGQWCNFIKSGTIQLVGIPPSYCSNLVPGLEALDAAKISPAEQRRTGVFKFLRSLTKTRANSYLLAQYGYGVKYHMYTKKKIGSLADFKGLRFRTNPTYTPLYNVLGIAGVQMSNGEVYTAMERGVIDGYALPPTLIIPFGLHKVTKYRFAPGFYNPTVIVLINQRTWDSMDAKQKAFMNRKGLELETTINGALVARIESILAKMEKVGVETIEPSPKVSEKFVRMAYDAMWATLLKHAPKNGAKLKQMLTQ